MSSEVSSARDILGTVTFERDIITLFYLCGTKIDVGLRTAQRSNRWSFNSWKISMQLNLPAHQSALDQVILLFHKNIFSYFEQTFSLPWNDFIQAVSSDWSV